MGYNDLRGWLEEVDKMGELKRVEGAHWDKEIGAISEIMAGNGGPALLFDKVPGYPEGYRVLSNAFVSRPRTGLTLGVPPELSGLEMLDAWRKRLKGIKLVPPVEVKEGPVKQNILTGQDVDLFKLPTPVWHELDGGRYLGTGCVVITRDPDEGWINLGTYRCRVFDKNLISVGVNPGKHGTMMMEKYHSRGEGFPIAIACGQDPTLFLASCSPLTGLGESEYNFAGGIKGEPIEVIRGEVTGLPIPATAEIVLEGEIPPPGQMEKRADGPFGEWRRTYNSGPHPLMVVKSIMHRDDPVILGVVTWKLPVPFPFAIPVLAGEIWNVLDSAGIPDVKGVWFGLGYVWSSFMVIAIKQNYPGHAKQAALAALSCRASTIGGQYVVVVDDDIDITNEKEVLWAICNRANMDSFHVISGLRTMAGAPTMPSDAMERGLMVGGRIIIDACWPYERRDRFPATSRLSPQYQEEIMKKWSSLF